MSADKAGRVDGPDLSPDVVARSGMKGVAVRRLNRVPLAVAGAAATALVGVIGVTGYQRAHQLNKPEQVAVAGESATAQHADATELLRDAPKAGVVQAALSARAACHWWMPRRQAGPRPQDPPAEGRRSPPA